MQNNLRAKNWGHIFPHSVYWEGDSVSFSQLANQKQHTESEPSSEYNLTIIKFPNTIGGSLTKHKSRHLHNTPKQNISIPD